MQGLYLIESFLVDNDRAARVGRAWWIESGAQ